MDKKQYNKAVIEGIRLAIEVLERQRAERPPKERVIRDLKVLISTYAI